MVTIACRVFGPGGVLEQDDGENWAQATAQTRGIASRRMKHQLTMGLGRGKIIKEGGLSRIEGLTSEHAPVVDVSFVGAMDEGSELGRADQGDHARRLYLSEHMQMSDGYIGLRRARTVLRRWSATTKSSASTTTRRRCSTRIDTTSGSRCSATTRTTSCRSRRTRMQRELDKEFTQPGEMAFFDDDQDSARRTGGEARDRAARGRKIRPRARVT